MEKNAEDKARKERYKVSVIVPVYNVEKYIRKCLESLVNQTLQDIEILVVNDGSPDNSQKIIDEFVEKYPDKVFSYVKKNGGLGDARNYGIDRARGEFIGFVDSDDWVDEKMYETMYEYAVKERHDVVICDLYEINDGWEAGRLSRGYQLDHDQYRISHYQYILNSLSPSFAWNKIYRRELFYTAKFPCIWYEDMGCTPILLSYAGSIGYLSIPLYYYRQRVGSITKDNGDCRILDVMKAWRLSLDNVKKEYKEAIEAAVYKSIYTFVYYKPRYATEFLEFVKQNWGIFGKNKVIQEWIKNEVLPDLSHKQLIPRKIHYFWFGNGPKSELIEKCIESWKRNAPDFEIIEWNESNCNIHVNRYVEEAYKEKKWAFVADYFRIEKICEQGGLYFDTDTELMREPSELCLNSAFFAFETKDSVHAGVFGAIPHHPIIESCRKSYQHDHFLNQNGTTNSSYTIVRRITDLLMKCGLVLNGNEQDLSKGIHIYPPNKLTLDMFDGEIIAQHHYDCSWWDVKVGVGNYKYIVLKDYFGTTNWYEDQEVVRQRDYYRSECERLENTTCWKITKPIRIVGDFLKRIGKKRA